MAVKKKSVQSKNSNTESKKSNSEKPAGKVAKKESKKPATKAIEEADPEVESEEERIVEEDNEDVSSDNNEEENEEDGEDGEDGEDEEDLEDVPLEDLSEDDLEEGDIVTTQRITINNKQAMLRILEGFKLDLPWIETLSLTTEEPVAIADVHNDLERELAFYQQGLNSALEGRKRIIAAGVPFSRPDDYFAEMVKSDEHMEKVRQRLLNESASIKASEDARKQRELKKFGKKVQMDKLQERQKKKAEELEKIKALKRKRKDGESGFGDDDLFDIELDDDEDAGARKKQKQSDRRGGDKKNMKRARRDAKYGFGGKKRHAKSNTAESSGDVSGFSNKGGKRKATRPGKARRARRGRS
ncbi:uncharacterized protein VTP21DRAFT_10002 [Calcarisporiella thermophila]|uniref:uncharacterized protein n=1 Tax=Calcarisporiella thermophila TaxID=911321 RepID=UPI00374249D3